MSSIYSIMDTAKWALLTHQKSLQVTSHNIANVGTPGFSRQELILETALPLSSTPGQIGTGVRATQIRRVHDRFLESQIGKESQVLGKWHDFDISLVYLNDFLTCNSNGFSKETYTQLEKYINKEKTKLSKNFRTVLDKFSKTAASF